MGAASQTRIGQFLDSIAQGFIQTPTQILIFFLLIAALLLFFCLSYLVRKRRAERELARRGNEILDHRLDELDLSDEQLHLLTRLARFMDKGGSEYALVLKRHVFDECVRRLRESEEVSEERLDALRVRIGFHIVDGMDVPVSSVELPAGAPLVLATKREGVLRGALVSQAPRGMTVQMEHGSRRVPPGALVAVHYHNSLGVFSFMTRVVDASEDSLILAHSSALKRHQRRAFNRLNVSLPVVAAPTLPSAARGASVLLDLGAGGATLLKKGLPVKRGDLIELSFSPPMEELTLSARVLRITGGGEVLHVRFESASETQRKKIIGFIRRRILASRARKTPARTIQAP